MGEIGRVLGMSQIFFRVIVVKVYKVQERLLVQFAILILERSLFAAESLILLQITLSNQRQELVQASFKEV
jgi:hypothetical protein